MNPAFFNLPPLYLAKLNRPLWQPRPWIIGSLIILLGIYAAEGAADSSGTKAGVVGYEALYGGDKDKATNTVQLPSKWIPSMAPNPHPDAQWFGQSALGLFMHWGIVSGSSRGEAWDQRIYLPPGADTNKALEHRISPEKMFERAKIFNPTNYHPDHWMQAASAGGFRYAVLTTRHHDAYFLGDSQYGDWHAGHYIGRDLIAPYVAACRSNHIKVGFYFSGPDWYHGHEYQSYNFPDAKKPPFYNWKHEAVESLPPMPPAVRAEIQSIALGQIRELLTKYGTVDLFWPDGGSAGFKVDEFRRLQPGAIWGRSGEYATPEGWDMMKMEYIKEANRRGYPWEFCTIGQGGSWHWSESAEKKGISAASLLDQLATIRARGGVLLINIGPRPDGEMPHWFYPLCDQLSQWMKTGAEAIYDINVTGPFPYPDQCDRPVTTTKNAWYVFPSTKPQSFTQPIEIRGVEKPASAILLRNGAEVTFEYSDRNVKLHIPRNQRTDLPDVVKLQWSDK